MWRERKEHLGCFIVIGILHLGLLAIACRLSMGAGQAIVPPVVMEMVLSESSITPGEQKKAQGTSTKSHVIPAKRSATKESAREEQTSQVSKLGQMGTSTATQGGAWNGDVSLPNADAVHLNNLKPSYPAISRRLGEEGRVLLSVHVMADGSVRDVQIKRSSGFVRLDQSAVESVKRWRYMPARRGGESIPYWYVQPIVFSLKTQ